MPVMVNASYVSVIFADRLIRAVTGTGPMCMHMCMRRPAGGMGLLAGVKT